MGQERLQPGRQDLTEIREALISHPEISEAEVLSVPELSARPVAAVVASRGVSGTELRQHVQHRLVCSDVPEVIALVPELPRVDGEADVAALTDQLTSNALLYRYVEPSSAVESWLARQWEGTLGLADIGVCDDFFELGGHSVSAISILTEINVMYGIRISIDDFFELATIDRLAAVIEAAMHDSSAQASDQAAP